MHQTPATGPNGFTKTLSFAVMHFTVAFGVAWALTGDIVIGGAVALVEPAVNTVAYHFHEQLWARHRRRAASRRTPDLADGALPA